MAIMKAYSTGKLLSMVCRDQVFYSFRKLASLGGLEASCFRLAEEVAKKDK